MEHEQCRVNDLGHICTLADERLKQRLNHTNKIDNDVYYSTLRFIAAAECTCVPAGLQLSVIQQTVMRVTLMELDVHEYTITTQEGVIIVRVGVIDPTSIVAVEAMIRQTATSINWEEVTLSEPQDTNQQK